MFWALMSSVFLALAALVVFIYYMKKGQFEESEDVKYQMFREDK